MKLVLLIGLVGLVGFGAEASVVPPSGRINEDVVRWFIGCANKSMIDGLPDIGVPQHNPLHLRNLSFPLDLGLVQFENNLTNVIWYNLPFLDIEQLTGVTGGTADTEFWAYFDWGFYWRNFTITGEFDWSVTVPLVGPQTGRATFVLTMEHVHWSGKWNSTIPDDSHKPFLNDFSFNSEVESTSVVVDGTPFDSLFALTAQGLSHTFWNHVPASAGQLLKDARFNGFWNDPDHPERIQAIIDHCNA
ncbi:uncharacterized protein LOC132702728 [Cylas formicarius]|uniref:uncharacterized protein LOC132702728 n=1 Tax=Cylas formicarius TaxID=197179 RepID=UPI002958A4EE|nr:uncharacterized protein LOC132702728 [Cylas formicarius]